MKNTLLILALASLGLILRAEPVTGGPKGGRLLDTAPLRAEFVVTADRRAELVFYDAQLQPTAPGTQVAKVIAEPPSGRIALDLETTATGFLTRQPLPAGESYLVVVQVRAAPAASPRNFRIALNLATCGECQRAEYACICEGH